MCVRGSGCPASNGEGLRACFRRGKSLKPLSVSLLTQVLHHSFLFSLSKRPSTSNAAPRRLQSSQVEPSRLESWSRGVERPPACLPNRRRVLSIEEEERSVQSPRAILVIPLPIVLVAGAATTDSLFLISFVILYRPYRRQGARPSCLCRWCERGFRDRAKEG